MDSKTTKMIPEKTLEIIREEAHKYQTFHWPPQNKKSEEMYAEFCQQDYEAGAKRGYELAMGDTYKYENGWKASVKTIKLQMTKIEEQQQEISRLKKASLHYRKLLVICKNKLISHE